MENEISPQAWRLTLLNALMDSVYQVANDELKKQLASIVNRNSQLHGNQATSLSFRGQYFALDTGQKPTAPNLLHKDLRAELKAYLQRVEKLSDEQVTVRGFLQRLLLTFASLDAYVAVLPDTLGRVLRTVPDHSIEPAPGQEAIDIFCQQHQKHLQLLSDRMMANLLLAPKL